MRQIYSNSVRRSVGCHCTSWILANLVYIDLSISAAGCVASKLHLPKDKPSCCLSIVVDLEISASHFDRMKYWIGKLVGIGVA